MQPQFKPSTMFGTCDHPSCSRSSDRKRGLVNVSRWIIAILVVVPLGMIPLLAQTNQKEQASQQPAKKTVQTASSDRGQQVFEQNCSRCHNPPEGFSPRISGTVALHMRVRANLSDSDYKALLHFLNP